MRKYTFAQRLEEIMKIKNITAAEISKALNISEAVISQYKSGLYKPKQKRLELFAKFFNVNEEWLMGYEVPIENINNEINFFDFKNLMTAYEKNETIRKISKKMVELPTESLEKIMIISI